MSVVVALVLVPTVASAADCHGGTLRRLYIAANQAIFRGTVTYPGASHESFVSAPGGFHLSVVDPDSASGSFLEVSIPASQFHSTPKETRYDGSGSFTGKVRIRNRRTQADTVLVEVRATGSFAGAIGATSPQGVRALIHSGPSCANTCLSACLPRRSGPLSCRKSLLYVPFTETGFGELVGDGRRESPSSRSSFCGLAIDTSGPRCDFLIDERCILPYPSSHFLEPDVSTPTGLRVHYDPESLPANASDKHIDPTDWNTLDSFSPGPMILALFPDTGAPVDLAASNLAFHTSYARSLDADHPTVLMDAESGQHLEHFVELDANTADVKKKALIIRPGRRLDDATRYLVAIRNLVDANGAPIRARLGFRALRDALPRDQVARACGQRCADAVEARRATMEDNFTRLAAHGVPRDDLLLAWDFTTASTSALTAWMVSIRDQAFALPTPTFEVTDVDDGQGMGRDTEIWAQIQGTFQAPLFMTADAPASRLNLVGGVPAQNGYATVPFVVNIPRSAVDDPNLDQLPPEPARATLWGHGLLGTRFQLGALTQLASLFNFVIAAVDMQGMSEPDVGPSIVPLISDSSLFHRIPERLHQGFLNHLLLGRLLQDPVAGFNSHPAFHLGAGGAPVIDTSQVFYSGGSQGGIFGGAIMGVATNFERGFLAVPGANYSTLLQRSIDFLPFFVILRASYPDVLDQTLIYPLIQQLWDRAEPQGYLPHILSGDLSSPPVPHKVLIHMATYDCEVSNVATEIMVRSLGIPQLQPVHRSFFGIPEMAAPFDGSAFVEVDPMLGQSRCHTPGATDRGAVCTANVDCPGPSDPASRTMCASGIPPLENLPPAFNNRAHGSTGSLPAGQQIDAFLRTQGTVQQFCSGTCNPD